MTSRAITDHEVAYGLVGFYKKKGTRRHLFTNYVRFSKFEALELYEITPFSNNVIPILQDVIVLDIYEFTSFSNGGRLIPGHLLVLDIYEFTSFSNDSEWYYPNNSVLDIYEFTSFSNSSAPAGG